MACYPREGSLTHGTVIGVFEWCMCREGRIFPVSGPARDIVQYLPVLNLYNFIFNSLRQSSTGARRRRPEVAHLILHVCEDDEAEFCPDIVNAGTPLFQKACDMFS